MEGEHLWSRGPAGVAIGAVDASFDGGGQGRHPPLLELLAEGFYVGFERIVPCGPLVKVQLHVWLLRGEQGLVLVQGRELEAQGPKQLESPCAPRHVFLHKDVPHAHLPESLLFREGVHIADQEERHLHGVRIVGGGGGAAQALEGLVHGDARLGIDRLDGDYRGIHGPVGHGGNIAPRLIHYACSGAPRSSRVLGSTSLLRPALGVRALRRRALCFRLRLARRLLARLSLHHRRALRRRLFPLHVRNDGRSRRREGFPALGELLQLSARGDDALLHVGSVNDLVGVLLEGPCAQGAHESLFQMLRCGTRPGRPPRPSRRG
mmetsp:Transcript_726/g.2018  ORF Transcript_726/g.2018 Transcript_726/m.2018 type:complete len:321 (+) Transcript_726:399-1361(+)